MSTYEEAKDQYEVVGNIRFAYRRFGTSRGVPLVLLIHFRGTMDHWDPAFINPLAAARPIIIMDNAGVGRSGGEIPKSFAGWAQHVIDVLSALEVKQIDLLGFSMGGCVAQMVALTATQLVRRLILAGTIPSIGEGVQQAELGPFTRLKSAVTEKEQSDAFLESFFAPSDTSQAAGANSFARIMSARRDRVDYIGHEGAQRQAIAFAKFMNPKFATDGSYSRLHEIKIPVLVANGSNDVLLPTENSHLIWKKLENAAAHLHLFPDSGHGFLYQYADEFSRLINEFLDASVLRDSRL